MGNSQSQVANIVNKSCMSVTNDFVSKNIATTSATNTNTQTFTLNVGVLDNCPLKASQKITAQTTSIAQLSDTQSKQLATSLQSQLSATLAQSADMVNGLAALTGGNQQDTTTNINQTIENSIQNRITSTNINQVVSDSVNTEKMTLNIGACYNSPISVEQGIVSNVIAQNILTQITNDILSSSAIASATANVSQTDTMHNQGLNDLVDSIGKALTSIIGAFTGPLSAIPIIASILCCVCCLACLYFLMSPAGQKATSQATNMASNYAAKH